MNLSLKLALSQLTRMKKMKKTFNYGESFNVPSGNSSEFRSRNSKAYPTVTHLARCLPLLAGHFKMTPETLNEGKRFLKVFIILVIQAKYQGTMARIYIQIRG